MRRRDVSSLIAALASCALWPRLAVSADKIPRIVFVAPKGQFVDATENDARRSLVIAFLASLRDLGYADGSTMNFEFYSAEGRPERIDAIATRVLKRPPDVVLAAGGGVNEVAHAFKRLTRTAPIVMANSSDPVMQGLVEKISRPGGNVMGFTGNTGPQFELKRLEILRQVAPEVTNVAYLGLQLDWESPAAIEIRSAAERLGMTVFHASHTPLNYDGAFDFITRERMHGLFVARNPWNFSNRQIITDFAFTRRMPTVYPTREYVEDAGLISYVPSLADLYRRAAGYVDKITKGYTPADLPVDQPTKFEFVINFKAAQAIGLSLPPSIFAHADEVIEYATDMLPVGVTILRPVQIKRPASCAPHSKPKLPDRQRRTAYRKRLRRTRRSGWVGGGLSAFTAGVLRSVQAAFGQLRPFDKLDLPTELA